jgi:GNAT superfamily N-acetyltransferase
MGRHRLCDYCRLQGLRPSPFFSTRAGCDACGTTHMKTAGYAEACALPSLAASSILDKNKEWHANVPTKWVKRRSEASQHSLSFIDPLRKSRDCDAQGLACKRLLRRNKLECCVYHPAPYRLCLFDCREGPSRGDVVATVHYDILKRYVNAVVVEDRWRRRGLSRLLLESALEHMDRAAPEKAKKPVTLYVTQDNHKEHPFLIGFYERQGFRLVDGSFGEMVKSESVDAAPVVAKPSQPPPPAEPISMSEEMPSYGDGAFFTAPLPVERLMARPRTSQRPRRPVSTKLAWPARPATAPASMFPQPTDGFAATDGFLAGRSGGRAAASFRARVDAAAADRDARVAEMQSRRRSATRSATVGSPTRPPTRVRAATGGGPTHISRPCSAQRVRPDAGVTLDEYLASSGVAVPRPRDLVNSGTRPGRSPPRTPSPPERKAQRRHSPIPADASAGQIRDYHRRQALSPARQRTVRTQSFRALPNCPYKSSDRRREHLRRIMLNA